MVKAGIRSRKAYSNHVNVSYSLPIQNIFLLCRNVTSCRAIARFKILQFQTMIRTPYFQMNLWLNGLYFCYHDQEHKFDGAKISAVLFLFFPLVFLSISKVWWNVPGLKMGHWCSGGYRLSGHICEIAKSIFSDMIF